MKEKLMHVVNIAKNNPAKTVAIVAAIGVAVVVVVKGVQYATNQPDILAEAAETIADALD